ncbi:MAG: YcaO-like family protein [Desertifilum sp. SIO1I2]|nr:YcaO-like family protein [Desertifilum sp. SIO1I2]
MLKKTYFKGTHRLIDPAKTLSDISSILKEVGIARCANITGLDRIGIPVCVAIKPNGRMVQVHNGKGLNLVAAQVSALMEAIEIFHYENPLSSFEFGSCNTFKDSGETIISPDRLPLYFAERFFSCDLKLDWVQGENLLTGESVWLPASAVYLCPRSLYHYSSNGLASGNHLLEATLHAIYELIERDAIANLSIQGRLTLQRCHIIALDTIADPNVRELIARIEYANFKLVLIWVKSCIDIHTFWAVLLDRQPLTPTIMVNMGYGTHLDLSVAATRAITEAAQSRLTFIYGVSEELVEPLKSDRTQTYYKIYNYFDRLQATAPWQAFKSLQSDNLEEDYTEVLEKLALAGIQEIFRANLTQNALNIPVVKVFIPSLNYNPLLTS